MNARAHIPEHIQHRVLDRSRRRCALCIHFNSDWGQKEGQIAHLDGDPSNFAEDNLAFLCLPHHDDYDTKRRQTKNLTIREAKTARDRLYAFIEGGGNLATAGRQDQSSEANIGNKQDEEAMIAVLKVAGSHRFQINQQTVDGPTVKLARQIHDAFILAGWIPNRAGPVRNFNLGVGGIMISGRTAKKNPGLVPILQSAFSRVSIDAAVDPSGNSFVSDASIVEIFVAR